jgi:hypothetical protein
MTTTAMATMATVDAARITGTVLPLRPVRANLRPGRDPSIASSTPSGSQVPKPTSLSAGPGRQPKPETAVGMHQENALTSCSR